MLKLFNVIRALLKGKKTYLISVIGIVGALTAFATGVLTMPQLIEAILVALGLSTLRAGITK